MANIVFKTNIFYDFRDDIIENEFKNMNKFINIIKENIVKIDDLSKINKSELLLFYKHTFNKEELYDFHNYMSDFYIEALKQEKEKNKTSTFLTGEYDDIIFRLLVGGYGDKTPIELISSIPRIKNYLICFDSFDIMVSYFKGDDFSSYVFEDSHYLNNRLKTAINNNIFVELDKAKISNMLRSWDKVDNDNFIKTTDIQKFTKNKIFYDCIDNYKHVKGHNFITIMNNAKEGKLELYNSSNIKDLFRIHKIDVVMKNMKNTFDVNPTLKDIFNYFGNDESVVKFNTIYYYIKYFKFTDEEIGNIYCNIFDSLKSSKHTKLKTRILKYIEKNGLV